MEDWCGFWMAGVVNMWGGSSMISNNVPLMAPIKSWPYFDPEYDTMSSLIDPPE